MNFRNSSFWILVLFLSFLPIASSIGALSTPKDFPFSLDLPLLLLGLGGILSALLAIRPVFLLWFVTIFALVVSGLIEYFLPSYWPVRWLAYVSAFVLFWPSLYAWIRRDPDKRAINARALVYAGIAFLLIAAISTVRASPPVKQVVVATKSLLPFVGVYAFFAWYPLKNSSVRNWMKGVLCIGLIQIPLILYQYFFIRASRVARGQGAYAADSVVGTMGGNPEGGGLSGALAIFTVTLILIILSFLKERELSRRYAVAMVSILTLPLLFMEVKIIFFYLPVGLFVLYYSTLKTRPKRFFRGLAVVVFILAAGIFAYQKLHWSASSSNVRGNLTKGFSYSFKSKPDSRKVGVLSRRGVIEYWWQQHRAGNLVDIIIGHGIGSSRVEGLIRGEMARKYEPKRIDRTGLGVFLWDTGVLGVTLLISIIVIGYLNLNTIRNRLDGWDRALARGLQSVFPLFILSFLYRNDIPYAAPVMFTVMASFGLVVWLGKKVGEKGN